MKNKQDIEIARYTPDLKTGLTEEQVGQRYAAGITNAAKNKTGKTVLSIILGNVLTFFNLLGLGIMLLMFVLGSYENLAFAAIILANTVIGIVQELRAKYMIEKLSLVTAPTATLIRDGKTVSLPIEQVTLDDVITFKNGDQICADCIVATGEVEVNESLLTGEADAIKKRAGDRLFSGSFVVSGNCVARVDKVGDDNYSAQLAAKAKKYVKPKSELMNAINGIIKVLAIIIFPLGLGVFLTAHFGDAGLGVKDALLKTAGSMIGMIPSGMVLLTSVALTVSVIRLAQNKALVQDLYCIEMLARVDTLCLDKTGTITDGTMTVEKVVALSDAFDEKYIAMFNGATEETNLTAQALKRRFGEDKSQKPQAVIAFSSARKYSAAAFDFGTLALGAPDFVAKTDDDTKKIVEEYAKQGMRVLMLCKSDGGINDDKVAGKLIPVALVVLSDTVRPDAIDTISWFKKNNVDIKVISGDNAQSVSVIAAKAGVNDADNYVSLEGFTDEQVKDAAAKYTVFGRVTPEQKALLIKTFKQNKRTVAMTGDGVNDILAMKEADCAVAMAQGSQASKSVAHLVLMDSKFSSMPKVVGEGRRVVNNIQNSSSLFLMKTTMTIFTTLLTIIIGASYPFEPKNLYLIEVLVIGLPSFFLALRPNKDLIKGRFISNTLIKTIPSGLALSLSVLIVYLYNAKLGFDAKELSTLCTVSMTLAGAIALAVMCYPYDKITATVAFGGLALVIAAISLSVALPFVRNIFDYVPVNKYYGVIGVCVAVATVVIVAGRIIFETLKKRPQKLS